MGFIDAITSLGELSKDEGLEPYLSYPLEKGGKLILVFLQVADPEVVPLNIQGVARVELADARLDPEMKLKYLYRNRVGSAASWAFSPIQKMGKPKKDMSKNRSMIFGSGGDWTADKNSHLYKIKNKLLLDYERERIFETGSVDRIMKELPSQLESVLSYLDPKSSHIFIFGVEGHDQVFLYPGEINAFITYFKNKLEKTFRASREEGEMCCAICHNQCSPLVLSKAFKFATADKVNVLHGLLSNEETAAFPICRKCFERVSSGRDRLQLKLNNTFVLPKINIWTLPEVVAGNSGLLLGRLINSLEEYVTDGKLKSIGEKRELRFFSQLAKQGEGIVFHFVFWERNNAQELVHLMVEDVPPERLAKLERLWGHSITAVFGKVQREDLLSVDWAIKSLYKTLSVFAGKSEGDKQVFRDFSLKVIGKMLKGEFLPVETFKHAVVKRAARLVYENSSWDEVSKELLYAQTWVDYMNRINQEVGV